MGDNNLDYITNIVSNSKNPFREIENIFKLINKNPKLPETRDIINEIIHTNPKVTTTVSAPVSVSVSAPAGGSIPTPVSALTGGTVSGGKQVGPTNNGGKKNRNKKSKKQSIKKQKKHRNKTSKHK